MIEKKVQRIPYTSLRSSGDLDELIERMGGSSFVLLGEASHGTHEYYIWRTAISRRLIEEKGFSFIAVEGDWPDCYEVNRYVKGYRNLKTKSVDVLHEFRRWPTWMWANWEVVALTEWMHDYNERMPMNRKVGFYGLDVYSLWESMDVIVEYLKKADPVAAKIAMQAYRCFEPYEEGHDYARAMLELSSGCRDEVLQLLTEVRSKAVHYDHDVEAALNTEMNAQVIANAEEYYRSMVSFRDESWNIRDTHMVETLNAIMKFHGADAKAIVWEHNTHIGDARYTDMRDDGLLNVGQLVREQHQGPGVFIAGFASYEGTVIAGRMWGGKMQVMKVPPARRDSLEAMLHDDSGEDKLLLFDNDYPDVLNNYLPHRAIGVVYHPERESGNYVPSIVPSRYDALIYVDKSRALHPLHLKPDGSQMPETYPFGV